MQTGVNNPLQTILSLHQDACDLLLCAALDLPHTEVDPVPEWIHLLPAGELRTHDNRGPFKTEPADRLILNSMRAGERLPIDENHATDLAAPKGLPAPARGWIVELAGRADGVWGKVEWTGEGRQLVQSRAYRGISPVLDHRAADGTVFALRRASLVNRPNLRGLATLHQELPMDLLARLRAALGLPDTADENAAIAAVTTLHAGHATLTTSLQSVALAAGLDGAAKPEIITATVTSLMAASDGDKDDVITSLQSELSQVTTRLNSVEETTRRERATAFVDGAIAKLKVGVKPLRERYITRHMADPAGVELEIASFPTLGRSATELVPPNAETGQVTLHAEHKQAAKLLGIPEADYLKTLQAEQAAR
jgi:phage I-like protein